MQGVPCTVLVVDDDPFILELITDCLSVDGFDVVTALDGQTALEQLQARQPAVIVLDYQMPYLDGPQFVQAYRQLPAPHAPLVLITASSGAERRAAEVRADAYLGKPFEVDALVRVVEQYAA